jgi:transcriptional regulator with XRE-family HTH domain
MTEHPLEQWLKEKKLAGAPVGKRNLAHRVGCSASRITQIVRYGSEPSLTLAAKLSEETGLPIESFVRQREAAE